MKLKKKKEKYREKIKKKIIRQTVKIWFVKQESIQITQDLNQMVLF